MASQVHIPSGRGGGLPVLAASPFLSFVVSLMLTTLTGVSWCRIVVLICISLRINDVEHLFACPLYIFFGKMSIQAFCLFLNWVVLFVSMLSCLSYLYTLAIKLFSSVAQSCPTLCDPMDCSMPGFPVHHQLPELTQTHVHRVGDAIQASHPLLSPSPPACNLSQHQGLFKWVSSSHQVAKVLELQHLIKLIYDSHQSYN